MKCKKRITVIAKTKRLHEEQVALQNEWK